MRPGCSLFRRVCPCRAAVGAAGCSVIAGHRCQISSPMARNDDVSPLGYPRWVWERETGGPRACNPVCAKHQTTLTRNKSRTPAREPGHAGHHRPRSPDTRRRGVRTYTCLARDSCTWLGFPYRQRRRGALDRPRPADQPARWSQATVEGTDSRRLNPRPRPGRNLEPGMTRHPCNQWPTSAPAASHGTRSALHRVEQR
jgi:hypothetical protein